MNKIDRQLGCHLLIIAYFQSLLPVFKVYIILVKEFLSSRFLNYSGNFLVNIKGGVIGIYPSSEMLGEESIALLSQSARMMSYL